MYGPEEQKDELDMSSSGIIPCSCGYIFAVLRDATHSLTEDMASFSVQCEFIEIYNERLKDLLDPKQTPVIREMPTLHIEKVTRRSVHSLEECLAVK